MLKTVVKKNKGKEIDKSANDFILNFFEDPFVEASTIEEYLDLQKWQEEQVEIALKNFDKSTKYSSEEIKTMIESWGK
jgi:hypothetical protein